jgi:hypothetical protein
MLSRHSNMGMLLPGYVWVRLWLLSGSELLQQLRVPPVCLRSEARVPKLLPIKSTLPKSM